MLKKTISGAIALAGVLAPAVAHADQPRPWQIDLQDAASPIMSQVRWFEHYTLWFIVPITILVMVLLLVVMLRFSEKRNPVASKTSHNTFIEVIWTVAPVLILLALAFPSLQLLNAQLEPPEEPQMTVKATGYQWYWGYEYQPDNGDPITFDAVLLQDGDRAALGKEDRAVYPHLLAVDNEMVVPVDTTIRVLVTAADVIHSFAMPAFGVKIDAVPGRLNETWFKAEREGLYYGQCSELCGKDHAFMPIAIRAVSRDKYDAWLEAARSDVGAANKALMASLAAENQIAAAE